MHSYIAGISECNPLPGFIEVRVTRFFVCFSCNVLWVIVCRVVLTIVLCIFLRFTASTYDFGIYTAFVNSPLHTYPRENLGLKKYNVVLPTKSLQHIKSNTQLARGTERK